MNSFKESNLFCYYQNLSPLDDCELLKEYALYPEISDISENKSWFPTFAEENPFSSSTCPFLLIGEELCSPVRIYLSNLNTVFQSFWLRFSERFDTMFCCSFIKLSSREYFSWSIVKPYYSVRIVLCQSPWSKLPECSLSYLHLASKRFGLVLPVCFKYAWTLLCGILYPRILNSWYSSLAPLFVSFHTLSIISFSSFVR